MARVSPDLDVAADAHTALATELGIAPARSPAWLLALAPAAAIELLALTRAARTQRRAALQHAIDGAMEHVPRLLRGALRRVLFA